MPNQTARPLFMWTAVIAYTPKRMTLLRLWGGVCAKKWLSQTRVSLI